MSARGRNGLAPVPREFHNQPTRQAGILLSDVPEEQVSWLWDQRIPHGKITILDGNPGLGKSAFATDLATRISVGRPFPDGSPCPPGGVVVLNAEDGLADTIRPRFEAAGGDATKVLILTEVPDESDPKGERDRLFCLEDDLGLLEEAIQRIRAALVIVDPLMAFLGPNVNAHKDQDVRRILTPLAKLAERTRAAILVIRHFNKMSGGDPLYRGGGSIGIIGAARSGLIIAADPEDPDDERRVLALQKSNLARHAPSLIFRVTTSALNAAARIEWLGDSSFSAKDLLKAPIDDEERTALDEAIQFLADELEKGPMAVNAIKKNARGADVSDATLRRAKARLKVRSQRETYGWTWSLPPNQEVTTHRQHAQTDEHLEHVEHLPIPMGNAANFQGAQDLLHEHLENSANSPYLSEGAQGAQGAQGKCMHAITGGIGCALCDPEHPFQQKRNGATE